MKPRDLKRAKRYFWKHNTLYQGKEMVLNGFKSKLFPIQPV